jgi:heme-degrading monooxygenase HmoA
VGQHYSHTVWIVKPGQEEEFVRRWSAFEEWSAAEGLSARGKLLRDVDDPRRFISFGPWETLQAIRRWRMLPQFQEHARRLGEVLERFDAHTLEEIVER